MKKMATLIDKYFSKADFDAIEAAVKKAEQSTSGEIIVELASHSRNWLRERLIYSFGFTIICALVALYLTSENNWGIYYNTTQVLLWGAIGFVIAYFGCGLFLKRESRRREIVWKRSLGIFRQLTPVRGLAGVLIFVSLEEDQAAIVADKGIASKVPPDYWQKLHTNMIEAIKQGNHSEAIIQAIETVSADLAGNFPREDDDINELPDRPKIID